MSGKTSTKSKDRYNQNAYARYTIRVRKDDILNDQIEEFMSHKDTSLNYLIVETFLRKYFSRKTFLEMNPPDSAELKSTVAGHPEAEPASGTRKTH